MKVLSLVLICIFGLGMACRKPIPEYHGKIWIGVPEHSAVERSQDPIDPIIYANDERFRDMKCFSDADFQLFVKTYVLGCKDWGSVKLTPFNKVVQEVLPSE